MIKNTTRMKLTFDVPGSKFDKFTDLLKGMKDLISGKDPELYTREDLVKFGNYLFSQERRQSMLKHGTHPLPIADRLTIVNNADIENWIHEKNNHPSN